MKHYMIHILPILFMAVACKNPVGTDFGVGNAGDYSVIYTVQAVDDKTKNTVEMTLGTDTTIAVYAYYGGILSPGQDIAVRFGVDPDLVEAYNQSWGTAYLTLPDGSYSTGSLETVIKKGERTSSPATVSVDTDPLTGPGTYVLPVRIESVSPQTAVNEELRTAYLFFEVVREQYDDYDRSNWSILEVSSASTPDGSRTYVAENAIDGNDDTFWHTTYKGNYPKHPHYISVDMGEVLTVHGFKIRARTRSNGEIYAGGHPFNVEFLTKSDKNEDWTSQGDFEMLYQVFDQQFLTPAVQARYFRFVVNSSYNNSDFASMSEIYAF